MCINRGKGEGKKKNPTYSKHLRFPALLTRSPAAVWLHKRLFLGAKGFNLNMSSEEAETDPPALTHSDLPLWKQITRQNKSKKKTSAGERERERGRRIVKRKESKLWRRGRRKWRWRRIKRGSFEESCSLFSFICIEMLLKPSLSIQFWFWIALRAFIKTSSTDQPFSTPLISQLFTSLNLLKTHTSRLASWTWNQPCKAQ